MQDVRTAFFVSSNQGKTDEKTRQALSEQKARNEESDSSESSK